MRLLIFRRTEDRRRKTEHRSLIVVDTGLDLCTEIYLFGQIWTCLTKYILGKQIIFKPSRDLGFFLIENR